MQIILILFFSSSNPNERQAIFFIQIDYKSFLTLHVLCDSQTLCVMDLLAHLLGHMVTLLHVCSLLWLSLYWMIIVLVDSVVPPPSYVLIIDLGPCHHHPNNFAGVVNFPLLAEPGDYASGGLLIRGDVMHPHVLQHLV